MSGEPTLVQRLIRTRFGNAVGTAVESVAPPTQQTWDNFSGGYQVNDAPEDSQPNANSGGPDMEVDNRDRLIRAPGIALIEGLLYAPTSAMLHADARGMSELLLFSPPYMGVKFYGATTWVNSGIRNGKIMVGALYGDVAVLTDGVKLYSREPRAAVLTEITNGPAGTTIAVFGARVVVGSAVVNGNMEGLAVAWSGAEGDFTDWTGVGNGNEFLFSGAPLGDRIIAMRPMNLNLLAILNRRSLWAATLTGQGLAPFRFDLRVVGSGCVAEQTAQTTDKGVIYLSDDGVRGFDGNSSVVLSDAINAEILPLANNGSGYKASYDGNSHRYYLYVPNGPTYVLDLLKGRWYKWSRTFTLGVGFPVQYAQTTWDSIVGTWDAQTAIWGDLVVPEGESRHIVFSGTSLGYENPAELNSLGIAFYPKWSFPLAHGGHLDQMFTTDLVQVRYEGASTLRFNLPNNTGTYATGTDLVLSSAAVDTAYQNPAWTGLGMGLQLEIRSGAPKISRAFLKGKFLGQRQA